MKGELRIVVAALIATLAAVLPQNSASQTQADGTVLLQAPSSGIRIDRVDFYDSGKEWPPWWGSECVALTNTGTLAVKQVVIDFAWTRPSGEYEFDELKVLNRTVASSSAIGLLKGHAQPGVVCRPTHHGAETGSASAIPHAFITDVVYQDGSTWSLVPPALGSAASMRGAPLTLSAISTYDYSSPSMLTAWHVSAALLPSACSTIRSDSAKVITAASIVYRHLDSTGADVGDDTLDLRSPIAAYGIKQNNCRGFVATMEPGLLTYAESAARGKKRQPPAYLYKGVPTVVSADVSSVTFADGTSWGKATSSQASSMQAQSDGTMVLQQPSSGIRIDRVDFYKDTDRLPAYWGYECATISNEGGSVALTLLPDFSWGGPFGVDGFDESYLFNGAPEGTIGPTKGHAGGACSLTFHGAETGSTRARAQVFLINVVYQNGTWWSLVPPVAGSAVNVNGAPAMLLGVTTYGYSAPMAVNVRAEHLYPAPFVCSTIENMAVKTITDVRIAYRHIGPNGEDLGDDQLDVRANIRSHARHPYNCLGFNGTMEPGLLAYAQMSQEGPGLEPPIYLYKGVPSVLSAEITSVDFADGTSWKP